jgi:hypothetical protein
MFPLEEDGRFGFMGSRVRGQGQVWRREEVPVRDYQTQRCGRDRIDVNCRLKIDKLFDRLESNSILKPTITIAFGTLEVVPRIW